MNSKLYKFNAIIEPVPDKGGAYIRFPYDIRKEFGRGRVKVHATFDGVPYDGSIVNMGVKKMRTAQSVISSEFVKIFVKRSGNSREILFLSQ